MIALQRGKIESQIQKVALYGGIDDFPVVRRERGVQPLLQIVINRLMVVNSPAVVDFRIKSFAAVGDRSSEQKYAHGAWRLFEHNITVTAESGLVQLNVVAVVAGIIAKGGPAVEPQLDPAARRAGLATRDIFRQSECRTDESNVVEYEERGLRRRAHNLLLIWIACGFQMRRVGA